MGQEILPFGLWLMKLTCGFSTYKKNLMLNKIAILIMTYVSYMILHGCRKSFPVVKNTLKGCHPEQNSTCNNPGFSPFNGDDAITIFSLMDIMWSLTYALFMFISGHIAEKTSLRGFLVMCLIFSGIVSFLFGIAKYFEIHSIYYFISLQLFSGIFHSFGWPSIIGIMGYWFGHGKIGSLLGIWNSNVYVGNILGQFISAYYSDYDWALSFFIPGGMSIICGIIMFLFVIGSPTYIGFDLTTKNISSHVVNENSNLISKKNDTINENNDPTLEMLNDVSTTSNDTKEEALGFFKALMIPGVLEYSFSLFFSKLVTYTFLFWLPFYISNVGIANKNLSTSSAGYMALVFDIGAIFGCFFIGLASDLSGNKSAIVCVLCQICSAISLLLYSLYGATSYKNSIILLIGTGFFTCAPSSLITTAVSTNLGEHPSLGTKKAKATIAAIIDGTGSIGSAIGPIVVKIVSKYGLKYLMFVMMLSVILSGLFLIRISIIELIHFCQNIKNYQKIHLENEEF